MNRAIALLLLCGVLVSICAHADGAKVTHPEWAIILTITDLAAGMQLEPDSELRFDNAIECKSIVAKVGRMPASDRFAAVLTCRKVRLNEAQLLPGRPVTIRCSSRECPGTVFPRAAVCLRARGPWDARQRGRARFRPD
jgi:hypothetical protein